MSAARGRAARIHPCLSVPPSEQRLMLVAYHLALADLRRAAPYADWGGLLTAAGLALRLLAPDKYTHDEKPPGALIGPCTHTQRGAAASTPLWPLPRPSGRCSRKCCASSPGEA